jgi:hypothetical protein
MEIQGDKPDRPTGHALPPASNGKLIKRGGGKVAKAQAKQQTTEDSQGITGLVQQVEQVFTATEQETAGAITDYAKFRGQKVVEAIASAPEVFHQTIEEGVQAIELDRESFRLRTQSIRTALFSGFAELQGTPKPTGLDVEGDNRDHAETSVSL